MCSTEVDTYLREKREREREWGAFVCSISLACVFDKSTSIPVGCSSFFPSTILSRAAKWSRSQSRESFDFSALETKVCTYCVVYKLHTYSHPTVPFFTTLLATHLQIPTWKKKKKNNSLRHTARNEWLPTSSRQVQDCKSNMTNRHVCWLCVSRQKPMAKRWNNEISLSHAVTSRKYNPLLRLHSNFYFPSS